MPTLLHRCQMLREFSFTNLDLRQLSLPPTAEIAEFLAVRTAAFSGVEPCLIEAALLLLEWAVALGLVVSFLGINIDRGGYNVEANRFTSLLGAAVRLSSQALFWIPLEISLSRAVTATPWKTLVPSKKIEFFLKFEFKRSPCC